MLSGLYPLNWRKNSLSEKNHYNRKKKITSWISTITFIVRSRSTIHAFTEEFSISFGNVFKKSLEGTANKIYGIYDSRFSVSFRVGGLIKGFCLIINTIFSSSFTTELRKKVKWARKWLLGTPVRVQLITYLTAKFIFTNGIFKFHLS